MNDSSQPASNAQQPAKGGPKNQAPVVRIKPMAGPARRRRRHGRLVLSFFALVVLPFVAVVGYLWFVADDQYSSTTGFTVRTEEGNAASELLGGLSTLAGGSASADATILYEFIQSQEIVNDVDAELDLRTHYAAHWDSDPVFALWPDASSAELLWYWQRVVRISFDQASGLIEVRVLAYDAEMSQAIARQILAQSQEMINELNDKARADALRYAQLDLEDSLTRLKTAREALTSYRSRTQIVDPESDLQGRMGVLNNLQQQLAEALIAHDLLLQTTAASDPRLLQAKRRIEVIESRILAERDTFVSESPGAGVVGDDYPRLIAEFEALNVDREYAEQSYRAALAALELARANVARQSRYLASYISPTLPDTSEFPRRFIMSGLALLFLTLFWSILALIYYSVRDRS